MGQHGEKKRSLSKNHYARLTRFPNVPGLNSSPGTRRKELKGVPEVPGILLTRRDRIRHQKPFRKSADHFISPSIIYLNLSVLAVFWPKNLKIPRESSPGGNFPKWVLVRAPFMHG